MDSFSSEENELDSDSTQSSLNGVVSEKRRNNRGIDKIPNPTKICNLDFDYSVAKIRLPKIHTLPGSMTASKSKLSFEFTSLSSGTRPLTRLQKYRCQKPDEKENMENVSPTDVSPQKVNSAAEEKESCSPAKSKDKPGYIVACQRGGFSNKPLGQRQDTGPGILWSVHRWTRPTASTGESVNRWTRVILTGYQKQKTAPTLDLF